MPDAHAALDPVEEVERCHRQRGRAREAMERGERQHRGERERDGAKRHKIKQLQQTGPGPTRQVLDGQSWTGTVGVEV